MILEKLSGWELSNYENYCKAYAKFGGAVCNHPIMLDFLEKKYPNRIKFYHREVNGEIVGAYFTDENSNLKHNYNKIPLIFENIILPICPEKGRCYLPVKTKALSIRHKKQFFNASYGLLNRRSVCIVKERFSKKTLKKRQAETRKFLANGGEILSVTSFNSTELSRIYLSLMGLRWDNKYDENDIKELSEFIESIRPMIFGNVLMFNGKPCAYDLIYKAECNNWIYFDDHNGSIDISVKDFSLGSILLSVNVAEAQRICQDANKEFIFSIGLSNKKWSYKNIWAHEMKLGKMIF
ncbi:GNAT family N-acetyltransferase [Rosenbergiella sp. S61]|uniref:GNAT family N-acetyltransferase n=1 Tax=Rosenbergiella gaditana TaxID=2726987 RepID=A0ABS5SV77_9GAMM|nr:GNAT family N-acetyltransferase [Rosenbergiella gaditana]MBT0724025.1 GNAT family N-acetyltransferase [Rosenbergiella gaditana]